MKKQYFIKISLIIAIYFTIQTGNLFAQINFTFTSVAGSYTANATPTPIHAAGVDDALSAAIDIGFTFNYQCVNYTQIKVSSNGWLTFNTAITGSNTSNNLATSSDRPIIAPLWDDLQVFTGGTVNFKLTGSSPSRVLTIEWKFMEWNYSASGDVISFQVKLYETTHVTSPNRIEFVYTAGGTAVNTGSASIGLSGSSSGDFYSLDGTGASPTASKVSETSTLSTKPSNGRIYRWDPSPACSGTPLAGTATPSPTSVCSGSTSTITLTGFSTGCGISYQWQSASAIGGPYSNIAGATTTSYIATVTANTYYQCVTTCSNGGGTNTSSIATVTLNAPTSCYCTPAPSSVDGTGITNITCGTINNTTGDEAGHYGDYTAQTTNVVQGENVTVNITYSTGYTYVTKIWVDWNNDGDFVDVGEEVYSGTSLAANPTTLVAIYAVPGGASLGNHRMRIGGADTGPPTPCYNGSFATFEDYTVNVTAATGMVYTSSTTTQTNTSNVIIGTTTQEIIGIQIVTTGSTSPITASSFTVNITGTTNAADISNLKLWTTGTSSTFATTTQLGATIVSPTGSHVITGGTNMPYTLSTGTNYFWITCDVTSGATAGNVIDGQCTSITVGGTPRTPTVQNPAGTRTIINQVTIGTGTSTYQYPFYTYYGYTRTASIYTAAEVSGIPTLITSLAWNIETATTINVPVKIYLKTTSSSTVPTETWNNMIAGATLVYNGTIQFTPVGWKAFDITDFSYCSDNLMVLCEANYGTDYAASTYFYTTSTASYQCEYWYDYSTPPLGTGNTTYNRPNITITKSTASAMSFTSCTATQDNISVVLINSTNQEVIGMQVVTSGCTSPLTASSFTVNITGTTLSTDITNLKLWTTGTNSTFAATTQLGATVVTPTGSNVITGGTNMPYTLATGTNYFWITYDIPITATINNLIDAQCTSITIGGTPRIPTVQNPAGNRQIKAIITIGTGTSTTTFPYKGNFDDARSQFIITAAELTANGLCSGSTLTSLSFNVSSKASTQQYKNFTLKIGNIGTVTSFSSATWFNPSFTTVYSENYSTIDASWNLHTFTSNFVWNGADNIVVESCFNNTSFSSDDYVYYTSTASSGCTAEMDLGDAGCILTSESTTSLRPNMKFTYLPGSPCSGTPAGGTTSATPTSMCSGQNSVLSLSGQTLACGITYQWQSSPNPVTTWTNISGATSLSYTASPSSSTNYRCVVTCTNSSLSANSSVTLVTITGSPTYATIPYSQSFEGPWLSTCDTRERPDNSWINIPKTGDQSWRRQDDGVAGAAWTSSSGVYSPGSSQGTYSACFNGYNLCSSEQGSLDLYINLSPVGTKTICFDYINDGSADPDDVMDVLLSTDGGVTFPTSLLSLANTSTGWEAKTITTTSTSATAVIRFRATGDCGLSGENIGIDNLAINLPSVPNCATYSSPSNGATNILCGIAALLTWASNGPNCFPPTSYDIYFGTSASPPFVANQTNLTYNPGTLLTNTTYYWKIVPRNAAGPATGCSTWSYTTGSTFDVVQTTPPITDGFEDCIEWNVVNGSQTNKWEWGTATYYNGSKSFYISNNGGTSNAYTTSSISTVHFYKDITFPAGNNDFSLRFYWKGMGESSSDYLQVFLSPTSVTPVAGTEVSSTYELTPYIYNQSTTWQNFTNNLPVACSGNETWRLIFSWHNDGFTGTQPPIAIDDIMVTITPRAGSTCSNPVNVTLPFSRTGETTNCMGNEYTNASSASCGSQYESGNDKVYKVLVGAAGCVSINITNASATSIGFQVYNGCPDAGGTSCIYNTTTGANAITFDLSADVNFPSPGYYYVIVDNWAGASYVNYDIAISTPGGNTINDNVCSATVLTLGIIGSGDNTCTGSTGEPATPGCWSSGTMNTIWYRVTVPASQDVAIKTTAGSLMDTQIDIYHGNACGSLTYVNCNDDASSCGTQYDHSYILVQGITSTYIYIRVDGTGNTVGTFSIMAIDGNNGSPVWTPVVGQDCGPVTTYTNPVCGSNTVIDNPGYFAYGNFCDFTGTGICLSSGERSSVWYSLNINANGTLAFDIVPHDYGNPNPLTGQANPAYVSQNDETDYDWALWKWESACDGLGDNTFCCTEIAAGSTSATRCNYDALGVTGMYTTTGTTNPLYPGFGAAYEANLAVTNGEIYVLAISNYANDYVSGYTLKFSATSPIAYSTPGSTVSWGSNTSNTWTNPGNWGGCSPPTCSLDAVISSGGAQPIVASNVSVQDLTINAGATLTINAGKTLTVCGDFTNNGILAMSPTSSLIFDNGSTTQYINGSLTGANKIGNIIINKTGGSVILNASADIGGITTQNTTSIFNVNNQTLKVGGNVNLAANTTLTNCPNIEFNGTLPQSFSNSSGTVSFTNVTMNNSGGGITLSGTATSSIYVSSVLTLTNGIIYTSTLPLLVMNAGSSVSGGGATSFVDGPIQKIGNTAFVFPVGDAFNRWARIGISNLVASETFQAQYFYSVYSNTISMAATPTPIVYNVSEIEYWQLDLLSAPGSADVTLYWENASSSGINSCANNGDLVVARFNGTSWENKNATSSVVTGSCAGTSPGTITSNNFTGFSPITFGSKTGINPLPAELISFTGKNKDNINILNWTTASEINNDFFTLERSIDAVSYEEIGTIKGSGNSNSMKTYQVIDSKPIEGVNYYRLKQTDFDGKFKFASNVVALEYTLPVEYVIFPNPATDEIMIYCTSRKEENIQYIITDISGRKIIQKNSFTLKNDNQAASIDIMNITEGIYFLTISDNNNKTITQKRFVKIK